MTSRETGPQNITGHNQGGGARDVKVVERAKTL